MKDNKIVKIKTVVLSIIIALTLAFIWGNSLVSGNISSRESKGIFSIVSPIFDFLFGKGKITHAIFRKIAHGVEYFVLGVEVFLMLKIYGKTKLKNFFYIAIGLTVAIIDETLQLFSNRGSSIIDVWIDFSGYVLSNLLLYILFLLIEKIKARKKYKGFLIVFKWIIS